MDRLICPFEVKIAQSDDGTITGYGSVFGNVDSHRDVVAKGAFKSSLSEAKSGAGQWPAMLLQHGMGDEVDSKMPVGIWTYIDEDDTGLAMQGKLALKTQRGAEAYELMKMTPRPALNGLSIGYRTKDFTMGSKTDKARRTLNAVDLVEVSLVTFPSNTKAIITGVKSELNTIREFESWLRDAGGYSIAQAKAIAASGYKAVAEDEDEDELAPLLEMFRKANPNHDGRGLFSSGGGGGGGSTKPGAGPKATEEERNIAAAKIKELIANHGSTPLLQHLLQQALSGDIAKPRADPTAMALAAAMRPKK